MFNNKKLCGVNCFCDVMPRQCDKSEEIVYFEDEELDAYKGIAADAYTEQQVAEFEEVLITMRPDEVPQWLHSLHLRGIELPSQISDNYFQISNNKQQQC